VRVGEFTWMFIGRSNELRIICGYVMFIHHRYFTYPIPRPSAG
jgi:hypothetical protein